MSDNLKVLADNRNALLLAEIGAWLHMFGKFHEDFLSGNHDLDKEIPDDVRKNFPQLTDLLEDTWPSDTWADLDLVVPDFQTRKLSIFSLIKNHRESLKELYEQNSSGFLRLMVDAHGRGSSAEKGVLVRFAPEQKQKVYPSTSLGYEVNTYIDLVKIHDERQRLYHFLQERLSYLKGKSARLRYDEWLHIRQEFIQEIEQYFRISVAETRRPLNDVTLFDQTVASVAFFKAALAQNLLLGWKEPYTEIVGEKYRWRLLRVGLDGLAFWGNSIRIGDILARNSLFERTLDAVKMLLEVNYPLGTEVYRDENGSIFIVPDIHKLHQKFSINGRQTLEECIQDIAYKIFSGETVLSLDLSDDTRNMLSFGKLAMKSLPRPKANIEWLKEEWRDEEKLRDVCPVCGSRPQGPSNKAFDRKVCDDCEKRRIDRSAQWIQDLSTTIWIDEVADINGRLALLVAQFGIAGWLSGSYFGTVLAFDPRARSLTDPVRKGIVHTFDLGTLIRNIQEGLTNPTKAFNDKSLLGGLVLKDSRDKTNRVQKFYDLRISGTDLDQISSLSDPERLALEMIRLSPSFSRVRRVWETTQTFWEEITSDFKVILGKIGQRLRIRGTFVPGAKSQDTLGISHTYELNLGAVNLSVTCIADGEFLTVDNLSRVALLLNAPEESHKDYSSAANYVLYRLLSRDKSGQGFEVEEPTGYGSPNRVLGMLYITDVKTEGPSYTPAISLLSEPRVFMAIVPADKALKVAQVIKDKYEAEVGKVSNRLPLTVGNIFTGRRTPLPAILEAGRRMLKQPTQDDCWVVKNIGPALPRSPWPSKITITLEKDSQSLPIEMQTGMGDGKTEDIWYSYWCVEKDKNEVRPLGRTRQFVGADGKDWVHITDLYEGDVVQFMPSRFDFEFLDTAARRFEISYDDGKRRGSSHPSRPYYLEQLDEFDRLWNILSNGLATSQIHNLIEIIETKRMEWLTKQNEAVTETERMEWLAKQIAFQGIVRDALNNANWEPRPEQKIFEQLNGAALSGQLADVVELYIRILKSEPRAD